MSVAAHRVSLLARVAATLADVEAPYALIGAAAMAVHGVARSTLDIDLLTLTENCLDPAGWTPLAGTGVDVTVTRGDADDPLAGVVRFEEARERRVDLVVGRHRWQAGILERAEPAFALGARVPTAQPGDLVLLKLFAGGSQDAWDIEQLLAGSERETLIAAVGVELDALPAQCRTSGTESSSRAPPDPVGMFGSSASCARRPCRPPHLLRQPESD